MSENLTVTLPFFGETKLSKVSYWKYLYEGHLRKHAHNGMDIDIDVHFKVLDEMAIKKVCKALGDIDKLNALGVNAFTNDYNAGGESKYYVGEWGNDIFGQIFTEEELQEYLAPTDSSMPIEERLLSLLRLVRIGIYSGSDDSFIVLDYAFGYEIDKGFRDSMLIVKMNERYEVVNIVMEG